MVIRSGHTGSCCHIIVANHTLMVKKIWSKNIIFSWRKLILKIWSQKFSKIFSKCKIFIEKSIRNFRKTSKIFRKIFDVFRKFRIDFSMKILHFENIFENFWLQIFKINFRHEKIIFFDQIFFTIKVWLATMMWQQLPVCPERITMSKLKDKKVSPYFAAIPR